MSIAQQKVQLTLSNKLLTFIGALKKKKIIEDCFLSTLSSTFQYYTL